MHLNIVAMPIVPLFLFKLSVSLAAVWCFYQFALRRLTFHTLNRWYLLGYALLSFVFPLINIGPMLPDGPVGEPAVLQFIPAMGGGARGGVVAVGTVSRTAGPSVWTVILSVLAVGSALLVARVIVRCVSLVRLRRKARLIAGGAVKIYQVDGPVIPFSFGNAIYINQELHTEKEWEDIILHEYVHIRQRHTVDILIAELICIVNWYNPFAWLIRYSIRQNLEFIADQQVLDKGVDRKGYQYHLLKVMGEPRYRLANNFNFSSLKKRIVMMNKMRSAKVQLLKLLFLLPLAAVLLVAFRDRYGDWWRPAKGQVYVNMAGIVFDLSSRDPLAGVRVRDSISGLETTTDDRGFYKLHIPFLHDSMRIGLKFNRADYDSTRDREFIPALKHSIGIIDNMFLENPKHKFKGVFGMFPPQGPIPEDPAYPDAAAALHEAIQWNDNYALYLKAEKDHGITLFYTSEDRPHDIIFLQDGTMEKYGYPGTPALEVMEKKYGFPADIFGNGNHHPVNEGYISRWKAISAEAEKTFSTNNPDVRAVVFPGDSRVIVVPVKGKPRVFDMDNDADVERTEFEKLYGRLPDCVPKADDNTDVRERKAGQPPPKAASGVKDTVKGNQKDTVPQGRKDIGRGQSVGAVKLYLDSVRHERPLFLVDGRELPQDTLNNLYPDQIESMSVLKDSASVKKYGEKGKNGVILIVLKNWIEVNAVPDRLGDTAIHPGEREMHPVDEETQSPITLSLPWKPDSRTVWIVDGKEEPLDSLKTLNPGRIKSISVLKDSTAASLYGERGRNGVVLVTLKQPSP
jgi:TonB-dependent SusC/RagA subfamily outer membrane receptor